MSSATVPAQPPRAAPPLTLTASRHHFWLLIALYVVGLAMSAQLVWATLVRLHSTKGVDFLVMHEAARAISAGDRLYDVRVLERDLFGLNYHLPPFAATLVLPFASLDEDPALSAWRVLSLAAHFGALALALRTLGIGWRSPLTPAALAVWAFCWPARSTIINGQWDGLFLLAVTAAWWAERSRKGFLAGAILAVAASVKPYPILPLGHFVMRRRWLAVLGALVGLAVCFGLSALVVGPRNVETFLTRVVPHLGATTAYAENQSLTGFFARLIELDMRPVAVQSPLVSWLSRIVFVAGVLVPLALMSLRAPRSGDSANLQYAAWVAAIPLGIPAAWMHYQQLLLLPFLILAATWLAGYGPRAGRLELVLYAVALVLVAFGDHYTVLGPLAGELWKQQTARVDEANTVLLARFAGPAVLLLSYKLYGALLLWALCLRRAWQASSAQRDVMLTGAD